MLGRYDQMTVTMLLTYEEQIRGGKMLLRHLQLPKAGPMPVRRASETFSSWIDGAETHKSFRPFEFLLRQMFVGGFIIE